MRFLILIALYVTSTGLSAKSFPVASNRSRVSGTDKLFNAVSPGDTILLCGGRRDALQFYGLHGAPGNYITIINDTSVCTISSLHLPYGISFRNCSYLRLSGKGCASRKYGISVQELRQPGAGIGISARTDHFEMEYVEICNTSGPGLMCKTEPDCLVSANNYVQEDISIHDNYIHHTGTEGMYIGSTAFEGMRLLCDSAHRLIMPPTIKHLRVYNNLVEYTGWDGIQISMATDVYCSDNTIRYDSRKNEAWQNCGLIIGGGAEGVFRNNLIEHGLGYGINCFGRHDVAITGNTVLMDSAPSKCALYVSDKLADNKSRYFIDSNTIYSNLPETIKTVNSRYHAAVKIEHNTILLCCPAIKSEE